MREETKSASVSVSPPSAYDSLELTITGPDNIHLLATFNKPLHKIDISDIILRSAPVNWVDDVEIEIESNLPEHLWFKPIKLKKWLADGWKSAQSSGCNAANSYVNRFAGLAQTTVTSQLSTWSAWREQPDGSPILYTLSSSRVSEIGDYVYGAVATSFADFVRDHLWDSVPLSNLDNKKVKETYAWTWKPSAEITFTGGQKISLSPGVSDLWQWFDTANKVGWSGKELFEFKSVNVGLDAESDGSSAWGKYHRTISTKVEVSNEKGKGEIEFGIQLNLTY